MQRIAAVPLTTLALLALAPAGAARAATLTTDTRCYQETQDVILQGTGFTPLSSVSVMRDGQPLGNAIADANGNFIRKFPTPELPRSVNEKVYDLSATDMLNTAATRYRATRIFADFRPHRGDPKTLRVRFSVNGFGLRQQHVPVYLHWVDPSGTVRKTSKLGTAKGTCGVIRATRERRLFPFAARRGMWILQFDTRERYSRATNARRTPWVRKPVQIYARKG